MRTPRALLAAALLTLAADACAQGKPLKVDFDGDGRADSFSVVRDRDDIQVTVQVAVVPAPRSFRFPADDFGCGETVTNEACDKALRGARVVKLDADLRDDFVAMFEIDAAELAPSRHARVVVLPKGEGDPLWFYWDARAQQIDYTSL